MSNKSVFLRVMSEAGIPKEVGQAIEMAVLECDLIGWRGDELGHRLLMWRDRKVKVVSEQIRRQLTPRRVPPKPSNQVTEALNVWVPPAAALPPRSNAGLPDVQPSDLPWKLDEPEQLPLPGLDSAKL